MTTRTDEHLLREQRAAAEAAYKRTFLDAFQNRCTIAHGLRAVAAKHQDAEGADVKIHYRTIKRWRSHDPAFSFDYDETLAACKDKVKDDLYARADAGDAATIRFLAKTLIPEEFGNPKERQSATGAPLSIDDQWAALEHAAEASPEDPPRQPSF